MKILNLTQNAATAAQLAAGVFEPYAEDKDRIKLNLTFDEIPTHIDIMMSANVLAHIASQYGPDQAMIRGEPFLMSMLEDTLKLEGITPLYAFYDGKGEHLGFVEI